MEFESLRDYVPGDDPRRIDWAASARRGRAVTRLYQHERNHTVIVAVDASRLMAGQIDSAHASSTTRSTPRSRWPTRRWPPATASA